MHGDKMPKTAHKRPQVAKMSLLYEIGVAKNDGDVRFLTGNRNTRFLRMRSEKMPKTATKRPQIAKMSPLYEIGVAEKR